MLLIIRILVLAKLSQKWWSYPRYWHTNAWGLLGSTKYESFDVQANIDLTGNEQQPDQTSRPNHTTEDSYKKVETRQDIRATVRPGEIIIRDPDKAYEITKDKHVGIDFYLSDTSIKAALEAVDVVGKTTGQTMDAMSAKLAVSGDLTTIELETTKKVAKALDDGALDLRQLITCAGRQGFNLMDWFVRTAYASSGCTIFDNGGKKMQIYRQKSVKLAFK